MYSCDMFARDAVVLGETTHENDFPVRLKHNRRNRGVGAGAKIDGRINCPVSIQPGDAVSSHAVDQSKISTQQNLPVDLDGYSTNRTIGAAAQPHSHVESQIKPSIRV